MKKRIGIYIVLVLLIISVFSVSADDYKFSLEGPETISVGDTLTLKLKVSGQDIYGLEALLTFNPEQLEFKGMVPSSFEGDWLNDSSVDEASIKILFYDNNVETPIKGQKDIISLSFLVKNLEASTKISLTLKDQVITYGEDLSSAEPDDISFTCEVIERVLSNNNYLKNLSVSNGTLNPAFNKETLNYTISVPYSTSKLNLSAEADAYTSTVNITNPDLKVGSNDIIILVTAETNEKRTYKIVVTRQEKPADPKSSNKKIKNLTAEYPLTPIFDTNIKDYIMTVPNSVTKLEFEIEMEDSKASYEIEGAIGLLVGENTIKIIARAEDLSVENYYISVFRQAVAEESPSPSPSPEATPEATESPVPIETQPSDKVIKKESKGMPYWLVIILLIIFAVIGFVFGVSINLKTNSDDMYDPDDFDEADYSDHDDDSIFVIDDSVK